MTLKRTMDQALQAANLGLEAATFISAGAIQRAVVPVSAADAPNPLGQAFRSASSASLAPTIPAVGITTPAFVHSPLPQKPQGPVSMTFRLPAELPPALLRVAMERKLRGEKPFTQQDIVAIALREWLERNAPCA